MATENADDRRDGSTSRSLLIRLKRSDADAWTQMVQLYSPLIIHWCQKQSVPASHYEDILQDVFRTVVNNIERFRNEKPSDTFRGWLRTITRSRVADHFRRDAKEAHGAGGTEAHALLHQLADSDAGVQDSDGEMDSRAANRQLYRRAIEMIRGEFADLTWQAFWRTAVDGQSARDIGDELHMRPGTVRVAKSRVLKRLREQLGDLPSS